MSSPMHSRKLRGVAQFVAMVVVAVLVLVVVEVTTGWTANGASPAPNDGGGCSAAKSAPRQTACRYRHDKIGHSRNKPWASDRVRREIIHRHNRRTRVVESRIDSREWWSNFKDGVTCAFYGDSSLNAIGCAGSVMGAEVRDLGRWTFTCSGAGLVGEAVMKGGRITPLGIGAGQAACVFYEYRFWLVNQILPRQGRPA